MVIPPPPAIPEAPKDPKHKWVWNLPEEERPFVHFGNMEYIRGLSGMMLFSDMPVAIAYSLVRYGGADKSTFLWFFDTPWWIAASPTCSGLNFGAQIFLMVTGFGRNKHEVCTPNERYWQDG